MQGTVEAMEPTVSHAVVQSCIELGEASFVVSTIHRTAGPALGLVFDSLFGVGCEYETMVFDKRDWNGNGLTALHYEEYDTEEEAREGHNRIVQQIAEYNTSFFIGDRV